MVPVVLAPGPAAPGLSPVLLLPGCPVWLTLVALQRQRPYALADLTPLQDDRHWPLCCGKGVYCLSAPGLRSASGPRGKKQGRRGGSMSAQAAASVDAGLGEPLGAPARSATARWFSDV